MLDPVLSLSKGKYWPPRLPRSVEPPDTPIWDALAVSAARYPRRTAMTFFDEHISYAEFAAASERLSAHLYSMGVQHGDRVLVLMQNLPQLVIAQYAIARANAVTVPVNPMCKADEIRHFIRDAGCRVAITTGDLASEIVRADSQIEPELQLDHLIISQIIDTFGGSGPSITIPDQWKHWLLTRHPVPSLIRGEVHDWRQLLLTDGVEPELIVGRDDLAILPYTSGTTGSPKGCVLTHGNVLHNASATAAWLSMTPETVSLVAVPMFHITGLACVMHATIFSGGRLVLMPRWDRSLARTMIQENQVSHWSCIPTMIIDLLADPDLKADDLSSLGYIGGGGSAMPEAIAARLFDICGLKFVEGYGLTETSAATLLNPCDAPKRQCLGIPFISTDVRVIDLDTNDEQPVDAPGEIIIRGPQVFQGYWRNDDATRKAFVEFEGQPYFRTGDIGYRDDDGYFFITDRLKRMINAAGYKVWPAEVEALLYRHPGILEACVIGIPDAYRGETVEALVVRRATHASLTETALIGWCKKEMSAYKVPKIVRFVEHLPKGASGKVLWRQLQEAEVGRGHVDFRAREKNLTDGW
ncbi:long-chain-fatty-acid--CoA ligase [Tardiphaga sp. 71_E8_N1_1]|uniref:long-chain-fatty-acid--CoA ligase n=1 Tax=Tardiphaga sp. 71_E8_N1_1 TaxID=3240784 RepID=UPI003F8CD1AE